MISITSNAPAFLAAVAKVAGKMEVAQAIALTKTAKEMQAGSGDQISKAFDRPVPFTKRATAIKPATRLNLKATVFIKNIQARYLQKQEEGGTRHPRKAFIPVPSSARRNQYGNMPKGYMASTVRKPDVFQGTINGVTGVWERKGKRLKLLVNYARTAKYDPRFHWRKTMVAHAAKAFPVQYRLAIDHIFAGR